MAETDETGGTFWIVQQGRTFTASRSVAAPDLTAGPDERKKVVWHKTDDQAEHEMMMGRAETHLGGRRAPAAK